MSTKNHFDGKKHAGKHTTLIDLAAKVVKGLEAQPEVSKIVVGIIKKVPVAKKGPQLKLIEEPNGWKLVVRGNTYVQELHICTTAKRRVAEYLNGCYNCKVVRETDIQDPRSVAPAG